MSVKLSTCLPERSARSKMRKYWLHSTDARGYWKVPTVSSNVAESKCPSVARNGLSRVSCCKRDRGRVKLVVSQRLPPAIGHGVGRVLDVDVLSLEADAARQVVGELVAEADAAAGAAFRPFRVNPLVVEPAQAEAHRLIVQVRLREADHVALDLGAGHQFQAEPLAGAAEGAAFHDVFPTGGTSVQSKFCSSSVMLPTRPASEFTPTPNISRPVCVSSGEIRDRQIAKRIAGGRGNHRGLGIAEQVAGGGDLGHGPACRRTRGRVEALAAAGTCRGVSIAVRGAVQVPAGIGRRSTVARTA